MNNKITILGAGSFGTAIAKIFMDKDYDVMIYTNTEEQAKEINEEKTNNKYSFDFKFNENVKATASIDEAINYADNIIITLPCKAIRNVLKEVNKNIDEPKNFISMSKGIEPDTDMLVSDIIVEVIDYDKRKDIAVVSGPSFSAELMEEKFTALTVASWNDDLAKEVQQMFTNKYIRVYTSNDVVGVQIGAAFKNVLALASGIITGMDHGENARAALITRGLLEMIRYGEAHGANKETFYGLPGIGDLLLTATSEQSRNFKTGKKIGEGLTVEEAEKLAITTVEGIRTTKAIYDHAIELGMLDKLPIVKATYEVCCKNRNPEVVIEEVLNRELKPEVITDEFIKIRKKELIKGGR